MADYYDIIFCWSAPFQNIPASIVHNEINIQTNEKNVWTGILQVSVDLYKMNYGNAIWDYICS